jgi:hypothetical protein
MDSMKIQAACITIIDDDGHDSTYAGPTMWRTANAILRHHASQAPQLRGQIPYKVNVRYADGHVARIGFDLCKAFAISPTIEAMIVRWEGFHGGYSRPEGWTPDQYMEFVNAPNRQAQRDRCRNFIEGYDLNGLTPAETLAQ